MVFRSLSLFIVLVFFHCTLRAQNHVSLGIGAELGFPSGNFSGQSALGIGASMKAAIPLSTASAITLSGGVMNFFGKHNFLVHIQDFTYAPLKAGFKYQLSDHFYAEGQLGGALPLSSGQKTLFIWSPGLGNVFDLPGKNKLELGIRYEGWTGQHNGMEILNNGNTKGFIGIRFAYVFGF